MAVVTGVSREAGIGAAVARRLAHDGLALFLTGWAPHDAEQVWRPDLGGADRVRDELRGIGVPVEHVSADLGDPRLRTG